MPNVNPTIDEIIATRHARMILDDPRSIADSIALSNSRAVAEWAHALVDWFSKEASERAAGKKIVVIAGGWAR